MKCWGRTKKSWWKEQCGNPAKAWIFPFCHHHQDQLLNFMFYIVPSIIAAYLTIIIFFHHILFPKEESSPIFEPPEVLLIQEMKGHTDFYIGAKEITEGEYNEYCKEVGIPTTQRININHPVVNISYDRAVDYCDWLSKITGEKYRLPTIQEWEYAASPNRTTYPWGERTTEEEAQKYAYFGKADKGPSRVASKAPTSFGVYDIAGNVWEWVQDPLSESSYDLIDGKHIIKGGSYRSFLENLQFNAFHKAFDCGDESIGFRVLLQKSNTVLNYYIYLFLLTLIPMFYYVYNRRFKK